MSARYYAQYMHDDDESINVAIIGWHIFDREVTNKQGAVKSIAAAINRHQAFKIRNSLNATDGTP